jgi:hypothetical protein
LLSLWQETKAQHRQTMLALVVLKIPALLSQALGYLSCWEALMFNVFVSKGVSGVVIMTLLMPTHAAI